MTAGDVAAVLGALDRAGGRTTCDGLRDVTGFGARKLTQVLNKGRDAEAIDCRGDEVTVTGDVDPTELIAGFEADEAARKEMDASRREMMRSYAEARTCRRQMLLTYFGQHHEGACGSCDVCADVAATAAAGPRPRPAEGRRAAAPADAAPFPPGTEVEHDTRGAGQVIRAEGDTLTVLFDAGGYRNLSLAVVMERGLLTTA